MAFLTESESNSDYGVIVEQETFGGNDDDNKGDNNNNDGHTKGGIIKEEYSMNNCMILRQMESLNDTDGEFKFKLNDYLNYLKKQEV